MIWYHYFRCEMDQRVVNYNTIGSILSKYGLNESVVSFICHHWYLVVLYSLKCILVWFEWLYRLLQLLSQSQQCIINIKMSYVKITSHLLHISLPISCIKHIDYRLTNYSVYQSYKYGFFFKFLSDCTPYLLNKQNFKFSNKIYEFLNPHITFPTNEV